MNYDELSEEQKEKLKNCKTAEEIMALAQAEGYELSDDELEAVSGGCSCSEKHKVKPICKIH